MSAYWPPTYDAQPMLMVDMMKFEDIELLKGYVFSKIEHQDDYGRDGNEALVFHREDGVKVVMMHRQDCCESVTIEDIDGDLEDLIGYPMIEAEEASREAEENEVSEEGTWTYYKLGTEKGSVSLRWLGESNGYYSEGVDIFIDKG